MTIRDNFVKAEYKDSGGFSQLKIDSMNNGLTKEQLLLKDLKYLANEYIELEKLKKSFIQIILNNQDALDFSNFIKFPRFSIKERFLKKKVEPSNISGLNVVSVDGSYVTKNFMNVDFSFLKAIAVKYYFRNNHIAKIDYYPDLNGFNNYIVQGDFFNLDEKKIETKNAIDMTFMEINLLNNMIEKTHDIDMIIIDGSIVIMPINLVFSRDLEISKKYDKLLKEYDRLYSNCKENGIILIGSIKDTRTSSLTNMIRDSIQLLKPSYSNLPELVKINYRNVLKYFCDIDLFNRLLKKYERSCIFNCKKEIDKIRDIGIKKEIPYYFPLSFYAFYLKTTFYDAPCRIEFFMEEKHIIKKAKEKANLISSILLPISSLNEHYGLPIPQIEAHRRAVFKSKELDLLFNSLIRDLHKSGIILNEKRRNRRPF